MMKRRVGYFICALTVVALGLGSRRFGGYLPGVIAEYAGDSLWALGVFLGLGCVAPRTRTVHRAAVALAVSYGVEVSQLYHAPWIDALRQTTLGALILGFGFLWSDLACYTAGVALGAVVDHVARPDVGASLRDARSSITATSASEGRPN
jgi:Protein of unknown function (DUF2809)